MPSDTRKFEGRWDMMSGDERVALIEARCEIRGDFPDELPALRDSFAAHRRFRDRQAAQRARFYTYRTNYLIPPTVTTL